MLYHAREAYHRIDHADYPVESLDRLGRGAPALSNDPVLPIAYAISEQAIAFLGPTFWILLTYLFVVEEFGH